MELLTQNSKLKTTSKLNNLRVFNFGIPAQDTCLWAGECKNSVMRLRAHISGVT